MRPVQLDRRDLREAKRATDAELFDAMAKGDLAPLGVLFDRHHENVRQFLYRASPNASDVDDLVQETFLTASRAAASFDGRESAKPFLLGVAAQILRRRRRTFARLRRLVDAFSAAPQTAPRSPEEATSLSEDEARIRAAVEKLGDEKRLVLTMVEWGGMSGVDVAKALDVPVGTIWRRLHEARAEIRRAFEKEER
jgi:RNA polymerase sigma-70 factor (ECF subfamily)